MGHGPLCPEAVVQQAYLVARRIVSPELARDIAQDTWIKYRRQLATQPEGWTERAARSWIWSVASNAARSLLRRKRPSRGLDADEPMPDPDNDPAELVAEAEASRHCTEQAWEILAGLSRQDRELVVLRTLEERSWREVAEILGENPRTLRSRFSRLMSRLRAELTPSSFARPEDRHV